MQPFKQILKNYWGYDSFRPLQLEIIASVAEGLDTLAVLPTGGGKSICFQVPALQKDGICLVISPLIALMRDQVENLAQKNIPALLINSGMSFLEVKKNLKNAAYGNYKFLYVSPERLETNLFLEFLPLLPVNLIAVDEAHCVSQWGYDFRPPYLRIAALRQHLPGIPILALTASATKDVQADICEKLAFEKDHKRFQQSFERPNLSYSVFNIASKQNKLLEVCKKVNGSGIVYCKSRKRTKEIADLLNMHGFNADFYHAGLQPGIRTAKQESWKQNKTRIIVCTNAFGMGIDKSDVRTVVHYDVPDALENYYQEAGRAGRDQKKAYAVLLYNASETDDLSKQSAIRYPSANEVKKVYKALVNYLQLPANSGEGIYFDFDINDFVKKFGLDIYTANYSLKILEQEDVLSYNEQVFLPATLVFTADKDVIHAFENSHPALGNVIKGLLRSYEGIFDYPCPIFEKQLAKFIQAEEKSLVNDLKKLQQFRIVDYKPQKNKPQLFFLRNRVATEDFQINTANILKRKSAFDKRVDAMISYVNNTLVCRSKMIGNYFSDENIKACGVCDNCINQKNLVITAEEFKFITSAIFQAINDIPLSMKELQNKLTNIKKDKTWKVVNYLESEENIFISQEGMINRCDNHKQKKGTQIEI
ncbi:MAG: RecQ family ATP-dependent DNA helicase [Chitinophagaceae bacterium]|nr:RecQ family ATP-dependent DNA helicase [Chitinophagaceae bacterium]